MRLGRNMKEQIDGGTPAAGANVLRLTSEQGCAVQPVVVAAR